jgi:hypothetical protein
MTWVNSTTNIQYYIEPSSNNSVIMGNLSTDNIVELTASATLTESNHDQTLLCDTSGGAITLTLSTLNNTTDSGYKVTIKKSDSSGNTLTISYSGGIDGATDLVLRESGDSVILTYHDGAYYVKASNINPLHVPNFQTGTSYTVIPDDNHRVIMFNNSAAASLNLPDSASVAQGFTFDIKKISGASLDVTILPNGADTIEGNASKILSTQYQYVRLMTDQTGVWYILGEG